MTKNEHDFLINYLKKEVTWEVEEKIRRKRITGCDNDLYRDGRISGLKTALTLLGQESFIEKLKALEAL